MKRIITGLSALLICLGMTAQTKTIDSLAVIIVDRMTDIIGDLESCSFTLQTAKDITSTESGLVKQFADFNVFMSGPDKLMINGVGDKGHRQMWYNGEQLAYYFREEHNYGIIPAPATTIRMIDSINQAYRIEFPAADFFYPAFTDDLLEHSDVLKFLGRSIINGQECFHILSSNNEMTIQIWISSDAYNLPLKYAIRYKTKEGNPQLEATFSDWKVNPNLPSAMFDFEPPPGSVQVRIMSASQK